MNVGDMVVCRASRGYHLTIGKEYEVLRYEPRYCGEYFTWPAYVVVLDDWGRRAHCHAHRFQEVS